MQKLLKMLYFNSCYWQNDFYSWQIDFKCCSISNIWCTADNMSLLLKTVISMRLGHHAKLLLNAFQWKVQWQRWKFYNWYSSNRKLRKRKSLSNFTKNLFCLRCGLIPSTSSHCKKITSQFRNIIYVASSIRKKNSVDHCVVCSSSIYRFWLLLWYLQPLLKH